MFKFLMRYCVCDHDDSWKRFSESEYEEIKSILDSMSSPLASLSRKELYFYLCHNPILIGDNTMSLAVDEQSGKKCHMIGARGFWITHGDVPEHWSWPSLPESWFGEVAELKKVYWFELKARMETKILYPETTYTAYLVFKFAQLRDGFNGREVEFCIYFEGNTEEKMLNQVNIPRQSRKREDEWMEIEIGEFFNQHGNDNKTVVCKISDTNTNVRKIGIMILGIEFRPRL